MTRTELVSLPEPKILSFTSADGSALFSGEVVDLSLLVDEAIKVGKTTPDDAAAATRVFIAIIEREHFVKLHMQAAIYCMSKIQIETQILKKKLTDTLVSQASLELERQTSPPESLPSSVGSSPKSKPAKNLKPEKRKRK